MLSFDQDSIPFNSDLHFGRETGAYQEQGTSATLYLQSQGIDWEEAPAEACEGSEGNPTNFRVEIRKSDGTQLGTTDWTPNYETVCDYLTAEGEGAYTEQPFTVYFDNNPLDGDNSDGPAPAGKYYLWFGIEDSVGSANLEGLDVNGTHGNGLSDSEQVRQGYFYITGDYQYLSGISADGNSESEIDAAEADAGASAATKTFSIVRDFQSNWNNPSASARTRHFAEDGKVVIWSTKPKEKDTAYTCSQNGGAVEPCAGDSPWEKSAASSTATGGGVVSLRTQIKELQDIANDEGLPFIGYTISHEPHDDAIIEGNGFYGANSAKCGTRTGGVGSGDAGAGTDPCDGTAADYLALYAAMRDRQQDSCDISGGITGDGYPCTKVKIIYIAVGSNMYDATTGIDYVGEDDKLRPYAGVVGTADVGDFDLFGADTYNYACFNDVPKDGTGATIASGVNLTKPSPGDDFSSTDDDGVGKVIRGTGIPAGTTVDVYNNADSIVLSQTSTNAVATVAWQVYDDGTCTDEDTDKWRSFEDTVDAPGSPLDENGERISVIGLSRFFNKKLIIAEYASHPGCDGTEYGVDVACFGADTDNDDASPAGEFDRAVWFQDMYDYLTTDARPKSHMLGFIYFHSSGTPGAKDDHDWRFLPANNHASDPTYLAKGTVGRSTWQSSFGSDAQFLNLGTSWTGSIVP